MHVRAYVRARALPLAAAGRPGSGLGLGLGLGLGSGFLYLAWFFLNQVSRSTPAEEFESSANGCVSARTDPTVRQPLSENRPGGWAVGQLRRFCPNRRNRRKLADENTLPERYK